MESAALRSGDADSDFADQHRKRVNRDRLRIVCTFLVVFGGTLFLVRPDPNPAQTAFRLTIVAVGLIGLAVLQVRGR